MWITGISTEARDEPISWFVIVKSEGSCSIVKSEGSVVKTPLLPSHFSTKYY